MTRMIWVALACMVGSLLPVAASAQATPEASPVASAAGWHVTEQVDLEVDGQPVALSPDGRWIAGTGPEGVGVCVWDVASLTPTCVGDDLRPDPFSMIWAPDSSAIAFTDGFFTEMEPNALWLYSVDATALTELAGNVADSPEPVIHRAPAWTPDSQSIVFMAPINDGLIATVWMVDRSGGPLEQIPVPAVNLQGPLIPTADGHLLFTIGGSAYAGIWQIGLDGDGFGQVVSGADLDLPVPIQIATLSTDGRYLTLWSIGQFLEDDTIAWYVLDLETDDYVPIAASDRALVVAGPVLFSDDGLDAVVVAHDEAAGASYLHAMSLQTGEAIPIDGGEFQLGGSYWFLSRGAGGQLLIATEGGGVLVTLEPATGARLPLEASS